MTPFHANIAFNAHHSPMGAYLSFTCGHFGSEHRGGGGLAAQLGKPANQDLFIGFKDGDRYAHVPLQLLPFFDGADKLDPRAAFTQQSTTTDPQRFAPYTKDQIIREYGHATDRWKTPDFEFSLYTPFGPIPDPALASVDSLRDALLPAITAELILDNTRGTHTKTAFFAINFNEGGSRILDTGLSPNHAGFALKSNLGISAHIADLTAKQKDAPPACDIASPQPAPQPFAFLRWWPHEGLEDRSNPIHLLGTTPGVGIEVPPGKRYALRLALGCHLPEIVTTRLEGRYLYNRYYPTLLDVLNTASARFCDLKRAAKTLDEKLAASGLSPDQQFLIAHATRSYYANTELLEVGGEPYWIVNEGEYCMMNTLDLAVDQVFWELDQNPWVVRNLLDNFLKRYSYTDEVKITDGTATVRERTGTFPADSSAPSPTRAPTAPGGLSFCHDQGSHNQFSPFGHSAYELKGLTGCFSYMTQEQLCNWILIAASYIIKANDRQWLAHHSPTLTECARSLSMRNIKIGARCGIPGYNSKRCGIGNEITTYDSLDASLGQAENNLYLAIKFWVSWFGLGLSNGAYRGIDTLTARNKLATTLREMFRTDQCFPAILDKAVPAFEARILPAIEPLTFLYYWHACDPSLSLIDLKYPHELLFKDLRTHTITLLSDKENRNKFPDGGIKLSSTSNNSWLSKIAIVQHVARTLFNLDENGNERDSTSGTATVRERTGTSPTDTPSPHHPPATGWERADAAHVQWLTTGPGAYWCASDQIVNGIAQGSRYYPRLITTALWLKESIE